MRILLDENLPIDLAGILAGHEVSTVSTLGWKGVRNSEPLRRAKGRFDVLLTMDRNLEFQQKLIRIGVAVLVLVAPSNRMVDLRPLTPAVPTALTTIQPGELRRIAA